MREKGVGRDAKGGNGWGEEEDGRMRFATFGYHFPFFYYDNRTFFSFPCAHK